MEKFKPIGALKNNGDFGERQLGENWWNHWAYQLNCRLVGSTLRPGEGGSWKKSSWRQNKSQNTDLGIFASELQLD